MLVRYYFPLHYPSKNLWVTNRDAILSIIPRACYPAISNLPAETLKFILSVFDDKTFTPIPRKREW